MFKLDSKTLEELSHDYSVQDIATLHKLFTHLKSTELYDIPREKLEQALTGLAEITKLKSEGKVYAFSVYDSYAARQGYGEGIELYLRQGNTLREYFVPSDRDRVYDIDQVSNFLAKKHVTQIYTGPLPFKGDFLGLHRECDPDDPITRAKLSQHDITYLREKNI
jgi:hypothetical protein